MFEAKNQKGYTKEWEDELFITDKCARCLECWEDIELGISTEKEFEQERDGLYRLIVRIVEKNPRCNSLANCHPKVLKVAKIKTSQDKRLRAKMIAMVEEVQGLIGKEEYHQKIMDALNTAEEIYHYLGRPKTLYDTFGEIGGDRKTFIIKRKFRI